MRGGRASAVLPQHHGERGAIQQWPACCWESMSALPGLGPGCSTSKGSFWGLAILRAGSILRGPVGLSAIPKSGGEASWTLCVKPVAKRGWRPVKSTPSGRACRSRPSWPSTPRAAPFIPPFYTATSAASPRSTPWQGVRTAIADIDESPNAAKGRIALGRDFDGLMAESCDGQKKRPRKALTPVFSPDLSALSFGGQVFAPGGCASSKRRGNSREGRCVAQGRTA